MKDVNILTNNGVNIQKAMDIFGDMQTYDEMLQTFLAEVPGKLSRIANFKEIADMAQYAILAHSLKSDARYFGFEKLAELAYQHELESKANNIYFIYDNYDALIAEANRIVDLVKKYMSGANAESVVPEAVLTTPAAPAESNQTCKDNTLLIVDDSEIITNLLDKMFKDSFYTVVAKDGGIAIDIIKSNADKISGILLDLNMPNVDGFAVLDYMRENDLFKKLPVSIITGNDLKEIDQKAFEYPIVDMLKKPFNERAVKAIVDKINLFNSRK